jgi:23S rRNA (guanosine2251-2'-O)-methyltransferase
LGATESVPWVAYPTAIEAIAAAKAQGLAVYAVEQAHGALSLEALPCPTVGIALVFGNEVDGVEQATIDACDAAVEVPQFGMKHSLNVSVCGGTVLWEATRRYRFGG